MGKRADPVEPLGQQHDVLRPATLGNLLDRPVLVVEARQGPDHILADGLEDEVCGFGDAAVDRADRHGEGAGGVHDALRPPVWISFPMADGCVGVKLLTHRRQAFLPGVVVQHEVTQLRVPLEGLTKEILGFPFMPVDSGDDLKGAWEAGLRETFTDEDMNPRGLSVVGASLAWVEDVSQEPLFGLLLDDQANKYKAPCAHPTTQFRKLPVPATDLAARTVTFRQYIHVLGVLFRYASSAGECFHGRTIAANRVTPGGGVRAAGSANKLPGARPARRLRAGSGRKCAAAQSGVPQHGLRRPGGIQL